MERKKEAQDGGNKYGCKYVVGKEDMQRWSGGGESGAVEKQMRIGLKTIKNKKNRTTLW